MAALVRLRHAITKSVINVSAATAKSLGPEWKREKRPTKGAATTPAGADGDDTSTDND